VCFLGHFPTPEIGGKNREEMGGIS